MNSLFAIKYYSSHSIAFNISTCHYYFLKYLQFSDHKELKNWQLIYEYKIKISLTFETLTNLDFPPD